MTAEDEDPDFTVQEGSEDADLTSGLPLSVDDLPVETEELILHVES